MTAESVGDSMLGNEALVGSAAFVGSAAALETVLELPAWTGTRAVLTSASGLSAQHYGDPATYAIERKQVFERAWVCVGLAGELATPGTVLVRDVGTRSILLTMDKEGVRHGFLNSCRHRGTELAAADCTAKDLIRCPYHRWGYKLDGTLVSTPLFESVPRDEFDKADHGLAAVRVDTWGCLLFACLDSDTKPLDEWLGDLPERMSGYQLETWHEQETMTVEIDANWKLISENFQEYYHLPWVHPGLSDVSRVEDHYRYQGPGMYCGQTTTPVTDEAGATWLSLPSKQGLDESDAVSGRHIAIFPNVVMSVLPNHVFVMRLEPMAHGRTRETCSWLLPSAEVDRQVFDTIKAFWLSVNGEDIDIVQRSQRGIERGGAPAGPLSPRFEQPLHRFHNMLADMMTADTAAGVPIPPGDGPGADVAHGGRPNPTPPLIDRSVTAGADR